MAAALLAAEADVRTPAQLAACGIDVRQDGLPKTISDAIVKCGASASVVSAFDWFGRLGLLAQQQVVNAALYRGYLSRQSTEIRHFRASETASIPHDLDYRNVEGLGTEARERLSAARPAALGALGRMPGLTPTPDLAVMAHLRKAG